MDIYDRRTERPDEELLLIEDGNIAPLFAPATRNEAVQARVAIVGTYIPRKCGIATFTADVVEKLATFQSHVTAEVYALHQGDEPLAYPAGTHQIACDEIECFAQAARDINAAGYDAVWLQHEFGIYGGADGEMVCDFADRIAAPLIVTFHTVLTAPSANQRRIVEHLIARASRIMVMSRHGRDTLVEQYHAPTEIVEVIPHGAPDRPFGRESEFKARFGLDGRNVLMTFGLLSPGKGVERVIEALPAIVSRHPETVYRIVGSTHPNLVRHEGEAYRERLVALAETLGVTDHVIWENRYLDTPALLDQLEACDIYLTPYFNMEQATSGTLSYAVALGKAVVSTPYVHAKELLGDGVGVLVAPDSSEAIAAAVIGLLDDRDHLAAAKRRAYAVGRGTIWPRFAEASAALVRNAVAPAYRPAPLSAAPSLGGVFMMSDATGILQHGIGIIPDRRHGYCLDDNARALMLMNAADGVAPLDRLKWSTIYASFVQHAWNQDRNTYRNFMSFDRQWCEDQGSDDSYGRALWALGQTMATAPDPDIRQWGKRWFDTAAPHFAEIDSPRALSFAMLGAAMALSAAPAHLEATALLERGGRMLAHLLEASRRPGWAWFEAVLAYDNPRLPQALIAAGTALERPEWTAIGLETLDWIADRQTAVQGHFRPIGCETFGRQYDQLPFDQQPLEAQAAVEAAAQAFAVTGDPLWRDRARTAFAWFMGANDRGVALADVASGRCRDGINPRGVNLNCGAESILAFQLAHVAYAAIERGTGGAPLRFANGQPDDTIPRAVART